MGTLSVCSNLKILSHKTCKLFFFLFFIFSSKNLRAEYEATGAGEVVDSNFFGGLTKEELEKLKKMEGAYQKAVYENFQTFIDGAKQTRDGGSGRYSSFGENHVGVNAISEHSINGAERVNIKGALGNENLSPAEIIRKNKEIMDSYCVKTNSNPMNPEECRNKFTGQIQKKNFSISAAVYDAGPAHGNDPNDEHRVYGLKESVREENKKFGEQYGNRIIQDAKKPGENINLEQLEIARLQLEQQKLVHTYSMAFALKAARLSGYPSAADEFKQIALNAFSRNKGNIKKAEAEIKQELAKRIAEYRVLGSTNLCENIKFKNNPVCSSSPPGTNAKKDRSSMAKDILMMLGASQEPEAVAKMETKLLDFYTVKDSSGKPDSSEKRDLTDVITKLSLSDLSGIVDEKDLKDLYASADPSPDQKKEMGEYIAKLPNCLEFNIFCYAGIGPTNNLQKDSKGNATLFQEIKGETGPYFKDTRELTFSNFAYAANRPLSETESIVTNSDFNNQTDVKLRTGYKKGERPYEEFQKNYKEAMRAANDIHQNYDNEVIQAYKNAGATQADIDSLKANYSTDKFDPTKKTFFQLFGGMQKGRDAVLSSWRTNPNSFVDPNEKKGTAMIKARAPASAGQVSPSSSARGKVSVPKKPRVN